MTVMTFFEKRRGWEHRKKDDPAFAHARLAELDATDSALPTTSCRHDRHWFDEKAPFEQDWLR
jgi:hypothetical protein